MMIAFTIIGIIVVIAIITLLAIILHEYMVKNCKLYRFIYDIIMLPKTLKLIKNTDYKTIREYDEFIKRFNDRSGDGKLRRYLNKRMIKDRDKKFK